MRFPTPKPLAFSIGALLLAVGTAATTHAQSILYQAPTGPGGTWNLYEYVLTGTTFQNANSLSTAIANPLGGNQTGYLADIQSAFENTVINQITYRGDAWIGLTDRAGAAPGATEGTFQWTSGAPVTYTNWNGGEPNNAGGEDAAHMSGGGGWNDNRSGYSFDAPIVDVGNTDEAGGPNFRYIRKWNTASATPLPGVRSASALSFAGSVSALTPAPTNGGFGVREVRGLTLEGNIYDTVNKALAGGGTFTQGQLSRLDVTDPDTNANGAATLSSAPLPFLSNAAGDDNNIISIVSGKVVVPSSGDWTIQVRGDDGFALRVVGQNFTSVNGLGQIDPLDSSTMLFYGGTGDSNTRGVLNLAAGIYDIEFVHFEGGGGANYEVSTAKGAITNPGGAQWLAMGDSSTTTGKSSILRLTGDATIRTAGENTGGGGTANSIAEARALLAAAEAANATRIAPASTIQIGDGQATPFPAGTPGDEFATKLLGSFRLDDGDATTGEIITITFGIFADDGAQLRILGQDFDLVSDFADGTATLVDVNGDMSLTADYFTGNTNAFGRISLTEGTYDFEAIHFEGTGGANISISYAVGDKTATGLDGTFVTLSTNQESNQGWQVVPEPSTGLLALMGTSLIGLRRRRK